ncbi:prolipoprotein diacylglyceryl transferase [Helicobacter mustelae]|uniref:Phosphatidylglycerol--prolipoprotein diacylglyceryl transferase n=1 Tax=Helicobacter mustelae (strain ATCC 43772 / CCUG 25715 / CIP 103759 / LMG 18044 / NCTC 12198 / R85-136P) TaxID=679897 RepID=D3UJC0_HELM1|nr:prolipoprotein diacylglyceryl transferase [Helicobacter mustelae]CBG40595.1 prolipoprotein diacylglyceryl transferase [Helicobacter mustelae 12198]SQH72092.1 prolipoprotein diacylglyceryl transferase [Helicobacter mustelae]STP13236.1 prolipoprotein diacylglyceryl transferase [Helicobacter mustelae]
MNSWNEIYSRLDPVAFEAFGFEVHWYSLAYLSALICALLLAKFWIRGDKKRFPISAMTLEGYFIWAEIGVILGARIGYIFIYDPYWEYYLLHPWQIFNPWDEAGNFVGIRGMSYHGALVGFLLSSILFSYFKKVHFLMLLDVIAISVPLAYVFGRVGNFLNQELVGRVITNPKWDFLGILVNGQLRYPSQLIEAFLEGVVVFFVVFFVSKKSTMQGSLIVAYGVAYSIARFVSEYFRQPDEQLGTYFGMFSMGQILSIVMLAFSGVIYFVACKQRDSLQKASRKKVTNPKK